MTPFVVLTSNSIWREVAGARISYSESQSKRHLRVDADGLLGFSVYEMETLLDVRAKVFGFTVPDQE